MQCQHLFSSCLKKINTKSIVAFASISLLSSGIIALLFAQEEQTSPSSILGNDATISVQLQDHSKSKSGYEYLVFNEIFISAMGFDDERSTENSRMITSVKVVVNHEVWDEYYYPSLNCNIPARSFAFSPPTFSMTKDIDDQEVLRLFEYGFSTASCRPAFDYSKRARTGTPIDDWIPSPFGEIHVVTTTDEFVVYLTDKGFALSAEKKSDTFLHREGEFTSVVLAEVIAEIYANSTNTVLPEPIIDALSGKLYESQTRNGMRWLRVYCKKETNGQSVEE
jgi:hypothetical protein